MRIHRIRHTFASTALASGESLPIIRRLREYRRAETTARYGKLARDLGRESAERIAVRAASDIMYASLLLPEENYAGKRRRPLKRSIRLERSRHQCVFHTRTLLLES